MKEGVRLCQNKVDKAIDVLLECRNKSTKKSLLSEIDKVYLLFALKKIPKVEASVCVHIDLPNCPVNKTTDVCLIVKDVDRKDREYERTEEFYRDLLDEHKVQGITKITPLKSIKLENQPYELKRRFALMYEVFLADSRVVRFLPRLLGKDFLRRRSYEQVDFEKNDLKKEIHRAMCRSRCVIAGTGNACSAFVGTAQMTKAELIDNIVAAVDQVSQKLPGGACNLHTINVKTQNTMSIPLYYSDDTPNKVDVVNMKPKKVPFVMRPRSITPLKNAVVQMTGPTSFRVIKKVARQNEEDSEDSEEDEPKAKKRRTRKRTQNRISADKTLPIVAS